MLGMHTVLALAQCSVDIVADSDRPATRLFLAWAHGIA
jgi:hypothetical protein